MSEAPTPIVSRPTVFPVNVGKSARVDLMLYDPGSEHHGQVFQFVPVDRPECEHDFTTYAILCPVTKADKDTLESTHSLLAGLDHDEIVKAAVPMTCTCESCMKRAN